MASLEQLPETKRRAVHYLKRHGPASIAELAAHLSLSAEAVRRHLGELKGGGWVSASTRPNPPDAPAGRPTTIFKLTLAGEHLFPKLYDEMFVALLDSVLAVVRRDEAVAVLDRFTERRIGEFAGKLDGLDLPAKLEVLKDLYWRGDPYVDIERDDEGYVLVEYNCPLLNVALKRPMVCSSSVNFLSRLLGVVVKREERFQDGAGRCVFRIHDREPKKGTAFELE